MGIGGRLDKLLREKGKRPGTLAREAGVSKNTVYSIIKRDNDKVDPDILMRLARALGVPLSALYGGEELPAHPAILPIASRRVPVLGSIACGEPIPAEQEFCSYTAVGSEVACDFALRCEGDSMVDARIYDGDSQVFCCRQVGGGGEVWLS